MRYCSIKICNPVAVQISEILKRFVWKKITVKKEKPTNLCARCEFLKKCVC